MEKADIRVLILVLWWGEQSTFGPLRDTTERRDPLNEKQAENLLMAKIIEFYTPNRFRKKATWVPPQQRGKLIRVLRAGEEIGLSRAGV